MPARMARLLTPASGTRPPAPTAPRDTPFEPLLPRSDRRQGWSRSSLSDGERLVTGTSRGLPRQGRGHLIDAIAKPTWVQHGSDAGTERATCVGWLRTNLKSSLATVALSVTKRSL